MTAPPTGTEDDARFELDRLAEKIEDEVPDKLRGPGMGPGRCRTGTRSPGTAKFGHEQVDEQLAHWKQRPSRTASSAWPAGALRRDVCVITLMFVRTQMHFV